MSTTSSKLTAMREVHLRIATAPLERRRPRDRKARILRAGAQLFARHGYAQVGVGDVAAAVGITAPAVYRHVQGKRELLELAITDGIDELNATIDGADGPDALVDALAAHGVERRELTVLWEREARHLDVGERRALRRRLRECSEQVATIVRPPGDPDADLIALALLAASGSAGYHRARLGGRATTEAVAAMARRVADTELADAPATVAPSPLQAEAPEPADRREALLAAATRLFGRRGYAAVSMDELGTAAGIAGPSIYRHFPSKSALLLTALERNAEQLHASLAASIAEQPTPRAALTSAVGGYTTLGLEHADLLSTLVAETINLPEGQRRHVRGLQREYVDEWQRLLTLTLPPPAKRESLLRVHGALAVINHVSRIELLRDRPRFHGELTLLATRALYDD